MAAYIESSHQIEDSNAYHVYLSLTRISIKAVADKYNQYLIFNRETEGVKIKKGIRISKYATEQRMYGIIGLIKLVLCRYLIVITKRSLIDDSKKKIHRLSNVWRIEKVNLIPLAPGLRKLTAFQKEKNEEFIFMVLSALNSGDFYYSKELDLGTSFSASMKINKAREGKPNRATLPPSTEVNPFIWNSFLLHELNKIDRFDEYCVRIINGFVGLRYITLPTEEIVFMLISRRDCKRVGSRFFTRGADTNTGAVANFVETEMIVEANKTSASAFIILRGSVPLIWQQWPHLSIYPKPSIIRSANHQLAFYNHFSYLKINYGEVVLIDLSHHGKFGERLHDLCKEMSKSGNPSVKFVELNVLQSRPEDQELVTNLKNLGFSLILDEQIVALQKGIVRISSLDCSDYTNVAQTKLAKPIFDQMLKSTSRNTYRTPTPQMLEEIDKTFNGLWLENGDALSLHYTGTRACKSSLIQPTDSTDFHPPSDWWLKIKRWYVNNLTDGFKQDSLDLIVGNYLVRSRQLPPSELISTVVSRFFLPGVLTLTTIQFLCIVFEYLDDYFYDDEGLCVTFWAATFTMTWVMFIGMIHNYVDVPHLCVRKR